MRDTYALLGQCFLAALALPATAEPPGLDQLPGQHFEIRAEDLPAAVRRRRSNTSSTRQRRSRAATPCRSFPMASR